MEKSRKQLADDLLVKIDEYLEEADWNLDPNTFLRIDPVTMCKHHSITALNIQMDRDLGRWG